MEMPRKRDLKKSFPGDYHMDDSYNAGRQAMIDWLPGEEEILETIVQEMNDRILEGYSPKDLAKALAKRLGTEKGGE